MNLLQQIEIAKNNLDSANAHARACEKTLEMLNCALSEQNCPYKIGDIIEIKRGYSHTGKKMIVEKFLPPISWRCSSKNPEDQWMIAGTVLKKDGGRSMFTAEEWS